MYLLYQHQQRPVRIITVNCELVISALAGANAAKPAKHVNYDTNCLSAKSVSINVARLAVRFHPLKGHTVSIV